MDQPGRIQDLHSGGAVAADVALVRQPMLPTFRPAIAMRSLSQPPEWEQGPISCGMCRVRPSRKAGASLSSGVWAQRRIRTPLTGGRFRLSLSAHLCAYLIEQATLKRSLVLIETPFQFLDPLLLGPDQCVVAFIELLRPLQQRPFVFNIVRFARPSRP